MADSLSATQVAEFLQQQPEFFLQYPQLLDQLKLPHGQKGTLSLVEMQLERQRLRIKELEQELALFAQLAHQQQDIFLALMPLQKKLAQTENLKQGLAVLNQWILQWELQQVKILLFRDQWQANAPLQQQDWLDRKAFELIRLERFGLRRFYLGGLTHKEKTLLFLPEEFPIGSVACCQLGGTPCSGLLIFSARDEQHFHNGQDLQFLKHLLHIVELHLQRWLQHHKQD